MTPEVLRRQTAALSALFGGDRVAGVRRDRIYITGRSHAVPARLYLPQVRDNSAMMFVFYHFGGGVVGTLEDGDRLCALIAKRAGAPVMSVEYRLAPEHKFPAGLEDAQAAYAWAVENASRFGAVAAKIAVGGESMGGNFAAVIAQQARAHNLPTPALQVLICPGVDFTEQAPLAQDFADAFPLTAQTIEYFVRHYLPEGANRADARLSPGLAPSLAGQPRTLMYLAGFDLLCDQGAAYAERLRAAGVAVGEVRFDTLPHGFASMPAASPAAEAAVQRIARETAQALKGQVG